MQETATAGVGGDTRVVQGVTRACGGGWRLHGGERGGRERRAKCVALKGAFGVEAWEEAEGRGVGVWACLGWVGFRVEALFGPFGRSLCGSGQ